MKRLRWFRTFGGLIIVILASYLLLSELSLSLEHLKEKKIELDEARAISFVGAGSPRPSSDEMLNAETAPLQE